MRHMLPSLSSVTQTVTENVSHTPFTKFSHSGSHRERVTYYLQTFRHSHRMCHMLPSVKSLRQSTHRPQFLQPGFHGVGLSRVLDIQVDHLSRQGQLPSTLAAILLTPAARRNSCGNVTILNVTREQSMLSQYTGPFYVRNSTALDSPLFAPVNCC